MSAVTITIELDRYICTELGEVREMIKTLDFSDLPAAVERIQKHANRMESALHNYKYYMDDIKRIVKGEKDPYALKEKDAIPTTPQEKLDAIEAVLKKKYEEW